MFIGELQKQTDKVTNLENRTRRGGGRAERRRNAAEGEEMIRSCEIAT